MTSDRICGVGERIIDAKRRYLSDFRTSFEGFWRDFSTKQDTNIKDADQRDEFYRQFSHAGWAGASGTDSVAIA